MQPFCDSSIRVKQSRLPFPISFPKTYKRFELIHVDIWDHYHHATLNMSSYFLSIFCDYSMEAWVYLMKTRT